MKTRKFNSSPQTDSFLATIGLGAPTTRPMTTRVPAATRSTRGAPRPARKAEINEGVVNLNPNGFGFVTTPEDSVASGESYFLRPALTRGLLTGDTVRFIPAEQSSLDRARDSRSVHQVISVEREPSVMLCAVDANGRLTPDEACSVELVAQNLSEVCTQNSDVVVVQVPAFVGEPSASSISVQVLRNLGQRTRPDFVLDYAQAKFGFDAPMPEDLLAEDPEALTLVGRLADMGDLSVANISPVPYVTIDGEFTLDFDDAVHVKRMDDGWLVHIAISDVAKFVAPSSALDKWAAARSTSVYLPGRKLPMLPEELSQGACSLQQGVPRYAVTQTLRLNEDGSIREISFTRELIRVCGQLSYDQVADFMENGTEITCGIGQLALENAEAVRENVSALAALYPLLASRRLAKGLMDFDEPDPMPVQIDGQWRLRWADRTVAHKLIEELMIMANLAAAVHLINRYGCGLFRHQPKPDHAAWTELRAWAKSKGKELPIEPCIKAMSAFVAQQDGADAQAAAVMKLRSAMRPAKYAASIADVKIGHFSLGMDWYTQFTSPIRRYPDLLVHRLVTAPADFHIDKDAFEQLWSQAQACTKRAHAAKMAERFVLDRLKLSTLLDAVEANPKQPLAARVIRQNQRGAKVLIGGWQTVAWLGAAQLLDAGYTWMRDAWQSPAAAGASALTEGSSISVRVMHVSVERPAYPELQVAVHTSLAENVVEMA